MKKVFISFVCFFIILTFTSCGDNDKLDLTTTKKALLDKLETTKISVESTTENTIILHPEIKKVFVEYADTKEEYTESQMMFDFIDKIANCESIPDVQMKNKIGQIKIQYKEKDDIVLFADLYLGSDGAIYAKYAKSTNTEFAYKISN